jgi:glucose/arabinose dehydrogenase
VSGFLTPDGRTKGRPVGVALDHSGALLIADDVGNLVWRVSAVPPQPNGTPESASARSAQNL